MGLFSGRFAKGVVTGLASSVDRSLREAMDKRDEEMSAARRFWQTRQVQKLDLKEAHDRRATKALDRLIREADGDVALGLAAYQAAGNNPDDVEKYLTKIDAVRDAKGTFNLKDSLILPADYKKGEITVDREAAISSVGMELNPVDASSIAINDPLSKIGLGLKNGASQTIANKVNALVPPSEVTEVEGLTGVQLDMSKMLAAERYAMDMQKFQRAMGPTNLDEEFFQVRKDLTSLKRGDYDTDEAFEAARNKLLTRRKAILGDISAKAEAEEVAGNTGVSDNIMRVTWSAAREDGRKLAGIGGNDEGAFFAKDGKLIMAASDINGYTAAVIAADKASAMRFVSAQRKDDGSFYSSAINIINTDQYLKDAYKSLVGGTVEKEDDIVQPEAPENKFSSLATASEVEAKGIIGSDPQGFAAFIFGNLNDINNESNLNKLYRDLIDSGLKPDEANAIISDAHMAEQTKRDNAQETYSGFIMPGSRSNEGGDEVVTQAEDGTKTVGNISWNPKVAGTMPSLLRDKDIPASVRELILEDYVALQNEYGRSMTKEEAMTEFGI